MDVIKTHTIVIGAGVIGLSIAREIAAKGHEVIILEKATRCGDGITSRNSGVIHSGLYYEKNSEKAKLCLQGKELLYQYAKDRSIPYQKCEKIIIASSEQEKQIIKNLYENGVTNGVKGLKLLTKSDVEQKQPGIKVKSGLLSETTGIIDAPRLIQCLESDLQSSNAILCLRTTVRNIKINAFNSFQVNVESDEKFNIESENLINAAGLNAVNLAQKILGLNKKYIPKAYYAKGHYFKISGKNPFNGPLIYPVNTKDGLGIHLTHDLNGGVKFGPDVSWVKEKEYSFDRGVKEKFVHAIQAYWPDLKPEKLMPDYVGIRPKIYGPKEKPADFLIQTYSDHGIKGLVNLFGIESPGLTSSLAIAKKVKNQLFDL